MIKIKKRNVEMLSGLLIIFVIIFMVFVIYYITDNKNAFFTNPLQYGIKQMGANIECSCVQYHYDTGLSPSRFWFNDTNFITYNSKEGIVYNFSSHNFSDIISEHYETINNVSV